MTLGNNNESQDIFFNIVKGLTLNFSLEVTDDAIVEIVIDKNTGSILRGSGNAYMAIAINTTGKFEIYGTYIVSEGIYEFRNLINKDFMKGVTRSWRFLIHFNGGGRMHFNTV